MIDVNVSLGHWPFRNTLDADTAALAVRLVRAGVTEAWAGHFDGLFQRDVAAVNARLAAKCQGVEAPRLIPFGTVNPTFPDWEEDLRRCHEDYAFPGIRLHPNFHGYKLDHPDFASLLTQAAERGLIIELVVSMEDDRTQNPLFRVPPVDPQPLVDLLPRLPALRLVLLNAFRTVSLDVAVRLAAAGRVWFDLAMLEGVDRVAALVQQVGAERILFGSHYPLFYVESAALKLVETTLPAAIVEVIRAGNARRLMQQ